ncbi:MAG: hypothetical protein SNJ82_12030 [Gemmataceae bacterium]
MIPLLLASLVFCEQDPEPEPKPKGPAPVLVKISGKVDAVSVLVPQVRMVTIEKEVIEEKDGVKVAKRVREQIPQTFNRYVTFRLTGAKGQLASGKKLDADAVAKALDKEQVVALSVDGKPVDPAYLRMLKPGTLVIEATPSEAGGINAPVPLPAPVPPPVDRAVPRR